MSAAKNLPALDLRRIRRDHLLINALQAASLVTAAFGLLTLLGWLLKLPGLATFGAGLIPMAPSTAIFFLLYGLAIGLRAREPLSRHAFQTSLAVVTLGLMLALLLLALGCLNLHWDIEQLGLKFSDPTGKMTIGHMSPISAMCFVVASLSFLASLSLTPIPFWRRVLALGMAGLLLGAAFVFLLAYAFGAPLFYGGAFIPPALNTIVAFTVLGLALVALASRSSGLLGRSPANGSGTVFMFILIFALMAAGIVTVSYRYFRNYERNYYAAAGLQLSAIVDLKANDLVQWRKERLADGDFLVKNDLISALARRFFERPEDTEAQRQLLVWLNKILNQGQFDAIHLLDAQGVTHLSAPAGMAAVSADVLWCLPEVMRAGQVTFVDFNQSDYDQRVYLEVLVPIFDERDARRPLGSVCLRINPQTYLNPFIERWPLPSETSETLLVRRAGNEAVYLNELRFRTNTALKLRIPLVNKNVPAVQAVLGQEGVVEGLDYRGEPVIAALRAVPNSPWFLVAKTSKAEVFAPVRERLWQVIVMMGVLLFGSGAGVALVWRQQRVRFYRDKLETMDQLRASEERFRRAVVDAPFPIMLHAEDGAVLQVSNSWCDITGYTREELATTADWAERAYGERKTLVQADIEALYGLEHRKNEGDYPVHTKAGGTRIWEFSSAPLGHLPDGRRLVISMALDVTERRQAAAALRENQQMLQNVLDHFPGVVFWKDAQSNYQGCNHAFAFGAGFKEPADIIGKNDFDMAWAATEAEHYRADDAAVIASGQARLHIIETQHLSDGRVIWLDTSKTPLRDLVGKIIGVLGVSADITERKLAEETVRQERDFSQSALDSLPGLFYLFDEQGRFLRVNKNFERVSGYSAKELAQMTPMELFDGPDQRRIAEAIQQARQTGETLVEADFVSKDRTRTPYFFTGKLFGYANRSCVMGMGLDITARKQAEEKITRTLADLERSNKELEHFAYVASHDLQEPLRMVASYTQLLAQRYESQLDDKARKFIHYAVDGAIRMQALINDLLAYSRVGRRGKPLAPADAHAILGEAIRNLTATIQEQNAIITNDDLPTVTGDASQLVLLFQNLLANAIKFRGDQLPRLHVSARQRGDEWLFAVQDNGIGIEAQYAERIFIIFQRLHTRAEYPGTGIGLAVCKRIVERHGGKIWFESQPGSGTTFFFTIPLNQPKQPADIDHAHETR